MGKTIAAQAPAGTDVAPMDLEDRGGVRAPTVVGGDVFTRRPAGPEPREKEHVIAPVGELIRLPVIHAVQQRSDEGRIYGEDAIVAAVARDQGQNTHKLVPCEFHSGQNPTPKSLYSYDPKTGRGVCYPCYEFVRVWGSTEQKEKLELWEKGLPYPMRRL